MNPNDSLKALLDGNARFAMDAPQSRPPVSEILRLASGQSPLATILACSDSRVPGASLCGTPTPTSVAQNGAVAIGRVRNSHDFGDSAS